MSENHRSIKVEPSIKREFLNVKAIRLYPRVADTTYQVNSTIERGEKPTFLVKAVYSEKRHDFEIEIAFLGPYHAETVAYYKKHPEHWTSWGEFVLSAEQARQLIEILKHMQTAITARQATSKQPEKVQATFGSMATRFDLSAVLYSIEASSLLSLLGTKKIDGLLRRAKSRSR